MFGMLGAVVVEAVPESGAEGTLLMPDAPRGWPLFIVRRWAEENGALSRGGVSMSAEPRAYQKREVSLEISLPEAGLREGHGKKKQNTDDI